MKTKSVCVRVPLDVLAHVDLVAESNSTTRTAVLVHMLRGAVAQGLAENYLEAEEVMTVVASVIAMYQEQKAPRR